MSGIAQFMKWGPFFRAGEVQTAPRLYHYVAGTTQQKDVWIDRGKVATATQPIIGNSDGVVAGYFSGLYKIVIKNHDDSIILEQWDNVEIVDPRSLDMTGEVLRIGPEGEFGSAEDTRPRRIRMCGYWADPSPMGYTSPGERIVFYEENSWKTAIGMDRENGLWIQAHGAAGQPAFSVWAGVGAGSQPKKICEITFDGRFRMTNGGRVHLPVVPTASLPAAGAAEEGSILIEDDGPIGRHIVIYSGGQRFRFPGIAPF